MPAPHRRAIAVLRALTLRTAAVQIPLIGWIGRLDHQKGPDIVLDAVPGVAQRGCQVPSAPPFGD